MKTNNKTALAISYIRFSTPRQITGDSIRRQTQATEAYCAKHGLTLTNEFRLQDRGVSAFRGDNLEATTALGQLLKQVEDGEIPRGTILIVESLDRLSRDKVRKALTLFLNLIEAGIEIVALSDNERRYNADSVDSNAMDLVASIMVMSRAHEESQTKSIRIKSAWVNKKELVKQGKHTGFNCPDWIDNKGDKYILNPAKAEVVKRIFKLYLEGYGGLSIARKLNDDNIPVISTNTKTIDRSWHPYQVTRILRNKAVIGTYTFVQPEQKNYYPAVVSETDYYAARAKATARVGHKGQRTATPYAFSLLIKCGKCGSNMFRNVDKGYPYMTCIKRKEGGCDAPYVNYLALEKMLLTVLSGMDSKQIDPTNEAVAKMQHEIDSLTGRIAELDGKIKQASESFVKNPSDIIAGIIKQMETDRNEARSTLEQKKSVKYLSDHRQNWKQVKAMLEAEIKAATGNTLTVIPVSIVKDGKGNLTKIRHEESTTELDTIALREAIRDTVEKVIVEGGKFGKIELQLKNGKKQNVVYEHTDNRPPHYKFKYGKEDWQSFIVPKLRTTGL